MKRNKQYNLMKGVRKRDIPIEEKRKKKEIERALYTEKWPE